MKARTILKAFLPLVALAAGAAVFLVLIKSKPKAVKASSKAKATLVQTISVSPQTEDAVIYGRGTVQAARQIVLQPEISGKVSSLHEALVPGGRISKGDTIFKIDARDYQLAVTQQRATVERARFEIEVEKGRRNVAEQEWELLGKELPSTEEGRNLVLRKPHEKNAKASLDSAQSALARARNNLQRTKITAPFNALVLEESIDAGQYVTPQTRAATLVDTDAFFVQVSIPMDKLTSFDIPGVTAGITQGSPVNVIQSVGDQKFTRNGHIVRLLGNLDPVGRMARVIVEVKDPMEVDAERKLPLLLGSFVQVEIQGHPIKDVFEVPRTALRNNAQLWLLNANQQLAIQNIDLVAEKDTTVLIRGLQQERQVITSKIKTPIEGMALRTKDAPKASEKPSQKKSEQGDQP